MLEPLNNGKIVASVSFRQEKNTIRNRKVPENDPENVENLEVFVVFDAISVQFPGGFVLLSNTKTNTKTRKMSYA